MPGLISPLSASGTGTVAGMKRPYEDVSVPTYGQPHPKKRKVVHHLRHRQPVAHLVEPLAGGFGAPDDQGFIETQLRRAIAIQCRGIGFSSARPEAIEALTGLVHEFMSNFTDQIRKSMSSARRTTMLPHDYIYALDSVGLSGSGVLEPHLNTGDIPPTLLQPSFAPPEAADPMPPDLEGMLGPELSGRADKEARKYIPEHFPAFPPKHTYKATPVYAQREANPHAIREKAAKEGIEAEKSLRKLMEKKKEGERVRRAARAQPKRSRTAVNREVLWKTALKEALEDEDNEETRIKEAAEARFGSDGDGDGDIDAGWDVHDDVVREIEVREAARQAAAERAKSEARAKVQKEWDQEEAKAKKRGEAFDRRSKEEDWAKQWEAEWERRNTPEQRIERRIQQRVTVNYGRKFWRKNARG